MKKLFTLGLLLSVSAFGATTYAPNDGSAKPGNPGTGISTTETNSTLEKASTDPGVQESVNRANTSVTPVPEDTDDLTLKGKTSRQSQESEEDKLDYRSNPSVDHDDVDASGNQ